MPTNKHTAIIIKRINLGEADRIVTAFSKEGGKIKFVAKGARKTKSKLAGGIELFCESSLMVSDTRSLDILTGAEIKHNYLGLSPNLEQLKLAGYLAEIVNHLMPEHTPNRELYTLVDQILSRIQVNDLRVLKIYFLVNLFEIFGISPEVQSCIKCGEKVYKPYFSFIAGGILDEDCAKHFEDTEIADSNIVKVIRLAKDYSLSKFLLVKAPGNVITNVSNLLNRYLRFHYDRVYKSELI